MIRGLTISYLTQGRLFMVIWHFSTLIIFATYTANLASLFTANVPIDVSAERQERFNVVLLYYLVIACMITGSSQGCCRLCCFAVWSCAASPFSFHGCHIPH